MCVGWGDSRVSLSILVRGPVNAPKNTVAPKQNREHKMAENEIKTETKVERENEPDQTPDTNGNEAPVGHGMAQGHFSSEIYKIELANIPKVTGLRFMLFLYLHDCIILVSVL